MPDLATHLLLSVAVFAGAFVSGLAGFAFSAVAGAILLRIFQPMEAVPLMMARSIGVQAANLWALRRSIQWQGSGLLILGGALGIPIAIYLLHEHGYARPADWLRGHCRYLCQLYAVPAGADAVRRNRQPASHDAGRIRRRPDRRLDGDAWRHSDDLVRHARDAEERPARAGPAVHRHHAGAGAGWRYCWSAKACLPGS